VFECEFVFMYVCCMFRLCAQKQNTSSMFCLSAQSLWGAGEGEGVIARQAWGHEQRQG
jgi:hypothetical protein